MQPNKNKEAGAELKVPCIPQICTATQALVHHLPKRSFLFVCLFFRTQIWETLIRVSHQPRTISFRKNLFANVCQTSCHGCLSTASALPLTSQTAHLIHPSLVHSPPRAHGKSLFHEEKSKLFPLMLLFTPNTL